MMSRRPFLKFLRASVSLPEDGNSKNYQKVDFQTVGETFNDRLTRDVVSFLLKITGQKCFCSINRMWSYCDWWSLEEESWQKKWQQKKDGERKKRGNKEVKIKKTAEAGRQGVDERRKAGNRVRQSPWGQTSFTATNRRTCGSAVFLEPYFPHPLGNRAI